MQINGEGTFSVDPANSQQGLAIRMKDTKTLVVTETPLGTKMPPNWSGTGTAPKAANYDISARLYTLDNKTKTQIATDADAKPPAVPPPPYNMNLP